MKDIDQIRKLPTLRIRRPDDDVHRTGGAPDVDQYVDEEGDALYQIDDTARLVMHHRARMAQGIPPVGNVPIHPWGEWRPLTDFGETMRGEAETDRLRRGSTVA